MLFHHWRVAANMAALVLSAVMVPMTTLAGCNQNHSAGQVASTGSKTGFHLVTTSLRLSQARSFHDVGYWGSAGTTPTHFWADFSNTKGSIDEQVPGGILQTVFVGNKAANKQGRGPWACGVNTTLAFQALGMAGITPVNGRFSNPAAQRLHGSKVWLVREQGKDANAPHVNYAVEFSVRNPNKLMMKLALTRGGGQRIENLVQNFSHYGEPFTVHLPAKCR
jgi:hypothetical protein